MCKLHVANVKIPNKLDADGQDIPEPRICRPGWVSSVSVCGCRSGFFSACCRCSKNRRNQQLHLLLPYHFFRVGGTPILVTIRLRHFIAVVNPTMQCKVPQPPTSDSVMHCCATFVIPCSAFRGCYVRPLRVSFKNSVFNSYISNIDFFPSYTCDTFI